MAVATAKLQRLYYVHDDAGVGVCLGKFSRKLHTLKAAVGRISASTSLRTSSGGAANRFGAPSPSTADLKSVGGAKGVDMNLIFPI